MNELARKLTLTDSIFLVIGSVFGSGIFLTSGIIAADLPSPGLIWLVWVLGGVLTLFGALIYAELGTMFPGSGGPYVYLREAYGSGTAFLYGWTFFWIIGGGGIAAIAMGFSEAFSPLLSQGAFHHSILNLPLGRLSMNFTVGQLVAILAIMALSTLNLFGVQEGAKFQNIMVLLRIGTLLAFVGLALAVGAQPGLQNLRPFFPKGSPLPSLPQFGAALLAVLWTYDGWYAVSCTAEEVKDPRRVLPRSLFLGTLAVSALYLMANIVYNIALPVNRMRGVVRIGEEAAISLFGPWSAQIFAGIIVVAVLGCLSANILYSPRIAFAMARDGFFFKGLAFVHPATRVPTKAILAQMVWASALCLTGTYQSLIEFVTFALVLFFAVTGFSVIVLRRKSPNQERPYHVPGYPILPLLYTVANAGILIAVIFSRPVQALAGSAFVLAGIPAYGFWRSKRRLPESPEGGQP